MSIQSSHTLPEGITISFGVWSENFKYVGTTDLTGLDVEERELSENYSAPLYAKKTITVLKELQILNPNRTNLHISRFKNKDILTVRTNYNEEHPNVSNKTFMELTQFGSTGYLYKAGKRIREPLKPELFKKAMLKDAVTVFAQQHFKPTMNDVGKWVTLRMLNYDVSDEWLSKAAVLPLKFSTIMLICEANVHEIGELEELGLLPASMVEAMVMGILDS